LKILDSLLHSFNNPFPISVGPSLHFLFYSPKFGSSFRNAAADVWFAKNCIIAGENSILFLIAEYVVPQCPSGCSKDFKITIE
jgi:hypothetical protein